MKVEKENKFLFKETLALLKPESTIVELGTIRDSNPKAEFTDGWSTLQWYLAGHEVHSIDTDFRALKICELTLRLETTPRTKLPVFPYLVHCNALAFLREMWPKLDAPIDLLYIDAPIGQEAADCFMLADKWIQEGGLVLVDDIEENHTQRKELLLPAILEAGYVELHNNGRQSLLQKQG